MAHLQALVDGAARAAPAADVVIGSMALAVGLVWSLWFLVGHAITIAHEGGHALSAILTGGRVTKVTLKRDQTGETNVGGLGGLAGVTFLAAGYVAPSLFGLAGAFVLSLGRPDVVLWASLVLLVLLLTTTRTLFGVFTVVVTGLLLFMAATKTSVEVEVLTASTWVWILLVGGLIHNLQHARSGWDHGELRKRTWIPRFVWASLFILVALAAIVVSTALLLGDLDATIR